MMSIFPGLLQMVWNAGGEMDTNTMMMSQLAFGFHWKTLPQAGRLIRVSNVDNYNSMVKQTCALRHPYECFHMSKHMSGWSVARAINMFCEFIEVRETLRSEVPPESGHEKWSSDRDPGPRPAWDQFWVIFGLKIPNLVNSNSMVKQICALRHHYECFHMSKHRPGCSVARAIIIFFEFIEVRRYRALKCLQKVVTKSGAQIGILDLGRPGPTFG